MVLIHRFYFNMRSSILSFYLLLFLLSSSLSAQELYKGSSPSGTIRYSDKPFPGAKVFIPQPICVSHSETKPLPTEKSPNKISEVPLYTLSISSPENNQIFSHETQSIPVKLILTPLPTQKTTIRLLLNGEALPQSDTPHLILPPLARGSYQLQAELLDPNQLNQPLAKSKTITFYQQRPFVKK